MTRLIGVTSLLLVGVLTPRPVAGQAAAPAPVTQAPPVAQLSINREVSAVRELSLDAGQNRLLVLSEPIARISVADPAVADLQVVTSTQVLLTAKAVGTTDLTLWTKRDEPLVIALQVGRNLEGLRHQLQRLFPNEKVSVESVGDLVVLSGSVSDVRLPQRMGELAQLHGGKVANLVQVSGDEQVQLEVKFAEVSRVGLREIGVNLFHKGGGGKRVGGITGPRTPAGAFATIPGTGAGGVFAGQPPEVMAQPFGDAFSIFFSLFDRYPFSVMLSLLESTGHAKTLAEPTLVALSGQEAKFLAGGEIPIPLASTLGQVSVQWRQFGIKLQFTPTVIGAETIHLKLAAEVSDLDHNASVSVGGSTVPGLVSRQSESTVRLADGQSFAIAGLLSDRMRSQIDRVPVLGDIPIIGALFRSSAFRREETELLVLVTARLVRPLAPHQLPPRPGAGDEEAPSDFEFFFLGVGAPIEPGAAAEGDASPAPTAAPTGGVGFIR